MLDRLSAHIPSPQLRTVISEGNNNDNQTETKKKTIPNQTETVKKAAPTETEGESTLKTAQNRTEGEDANKTEEQDVSKEKLEKVVESLNQFIQPAQTSVHFAYHEKLDEYYVQIVDNETEEMVREIPSKKLMDMHAQMLEFVGIMIDQKI